MKTYTVTIAGPERFDGEKPHTWVVNAADIYEAAGKALREHCEAQEQSIEDIKIIGAESFEGVPAPDCGYNWNDMRKETA
ncbi:hypothetical protein [Nonomuraea sp. NPDC049141]|uniref:hypothetical protein n=1 Tax=Nonomuraea sp. NPDC049141 TaxID=3155500 RepID=UPI0033C56774